jgi:tetratricopeptide (TPR) repeat protein
MIMPRFVALLALCTVLCASVARAEVPARAHEAFADGRFILAATLCEAEASAEALAFAARARIADAITRDDDVCLDCLVHAEQTAKAAIARDPNLAEAYVQLAIAIGFRGRLVSAFLAQADGLAESGRAAIDKALELDPANIWARASLGGWHLEIVSRAGPFLARTLYDANEEDGLKFFHEALAADLGSLVVHYHFALSILALDAERFRAEAEKSLADGAKDPRADALTLFTRTRAENLRALLKSGSDGEISALVRKYQGYPPGD